MIGSAPDRNGQEERDLEGFHPQAFSKADPTPDRLFYAMPRFVTHIDDGAVAAVTQLYRTVLREQGTLLDLMGSWVSHLPPEMVFERVLGHGLNAEELAANPRLDDFFVRDLNQDPTLPLADASLDGVCCCVSVQYLQHPVAVFREVARVLRPSAPFVVTLSNRCFPSKAVAIWQALPPDDRHKLMALLLSRAGFASIETGFVAPQDETGGEDGRWRDPIWGIVARKLGSDEPD